MALRGTLTHRKTRRLAAALHISNSYALGLLEALWHVTAEQAYQGNIGRLSNADIAMELYWEGDPDTLIEALLSSGWLDTHPLERLLIHDWHQHADYNLRRKLLKHHLKFITTDGEKEPVETRDNAPQPAETGDDASGRVKTRRKSIPEPEARARSQSQKTTPPDPPQAADWGDDDDDPDLVSRKLIAEIHPKHPVLCSRDLAITACFQEMEKYPTQKPGKLANEWRALHAKHSEEWRTNRAADPRSFIPHLHVWFKQGMYLQQNTRASPNAATAARPLGKPKTAEELL